MLRPQIYTDEEFKWINTDLRRTRQTLWGECTDANLKTVAKRYMIEKK